jgi:O-succinylbenzoic acid--CoA ligase
MAMITRAAVMGSTLVLRGPFHAATFISLVVAGGVSHASLVPTMLHRVLNGWGESPVPDSLRCLLIGGGPAPEELVRAALDRGFPVFLTYGLTQASSQVATASPSLLRIKPGTVGPPLPGVRIKIAESGELSVKGPTVSPGLGGEGGWLSTGDLARKDADGDLWITGRISDRIITGGVNVDPGEVEAALAAHPEVEEVSVVGIPDPEWGERVVAAVVLGPDGHLGEEELDVLARSVLSGPMRPKSLRVVESLPRNANGKVHRQRVRELFR